MAGPGEQEAAVGGCYREAVAVGDRAQGLLARARSLSAIARGWHPHLRVRREVHAALPLYARAATVAVHVVDAGDAGVVAQHARAFGFLVVRDAGFRAAAGRRDAVGVDLALCRRGRGRPDGSRLDGRSGVFSGDRSRRRRALNDLWRAGEDEEERGVEVVHAVLVDHSTWMLEALGPSYRTPAPYCRSSSYLS